MRPLLIAALFVPLIAPAAAWAECQGAAVDACFRPGPTSCEARIVAEIDGAGLSVMVQAYGFTSVPIIQAIGRAKGRGADVRAILDKDNRQARYTGATYLGNAGVPVRIDDRVSIAHNKVIVIDGETVIGGSFNYTGSAERRNAENVTIIRSGCVAAGR